MASGLPFEDEQFDLATQGRRNPGSSMKPIALVAALEQGISLRSYWPGGPTVVLQCPSICGADGSREWRVSNAGGGGGSVTLEEATYRSINTAYAALSLEVGPENVVDMARRMGITSPDLQQSRRSCSAQAPSRHWRWRLPTPTSPPTDTTPTRI
jgi:membrane peptidoglycan carboxypeptidase